MQVVILAGGLGTRLLEETAAKPKPMVQIGGRPILWHIMKIFAHFEFKDFVICLGYKGEVIKNYFLNYYHLSRNLTLSLRDGTVYVHEGESEDWRITLVDTGQATQTGGRVRRIKNFIGADRFFLTYGDVVADIDIRELLAFHRHHRRLATVTAVYPPARFGSLELDGEQVVRFCEKPLLGEGLISGGFFVFEPEVVDYLVDDDTVLERDPLETLARNGQLMAYRYRGFWQCMDTLKEANTLNQLWASGKAPWKVWE
ncbi:MAG: glucose-1-phosphate cytidylyltransferase [Firmicutes bacterium]|nr:glucose-1-phosphate cytidylyltransferase [Bacillota bacterium]MCL5039876.1 glucose-1-phosphate cytidylyltransferase [Bacillota bacterium]